jgi:hypothetical protein
MICELTAFAQLVRLGGSRGGTILDTIDFAPPRIAACARDTRYLDTLTSTPTRTRNFDGTDAKLISTNVMLTQRDAYSTRLN